MGYDYRKVCEDAAKAVPLENQQEYLNHRELYGYEWARYLSKVMEITDDLLNDFNDIISLKSQWEKGGEENTRTYLLKSIGIAINAIEKAGVSKKASQESKDTPQ